jgi:signal peptidase I
LKENEIKVRDAWKARNGEAIEQSAEQLSASISRMYPDRRFPRFRENFEILVVALAVAMGFRTYFIQPFKIPTGSMQPTLYGITVKPQEQKTWSDRFPLNIAKLALFGQRYVEVKAKASGEVGLYSEKPGASIGLDVGGYLHNIERGMMLHCRLGEFIEKGEVLASGVKTIGDHIFVNKVRYNFSRPNRGEIIVFDTSNIKYEGIRPDSFYIKRLAGMPGDRISIQPPYLLADGQQVTNPPAFEWLIKDKPRFIDPGNYRYAPGYSLANPRAKILTDLNRAGAELPVGEDEFLPLGDNTEHSLDGRYFGPVDEQELVGPAFAVYWPLSPRWGFIRLRKPPDH